MPLYEYECNACGHRFEVIQKFSDAPVETCPSCSGEGRKLLPSPAIQSKGTGWYITDSAKKSGASSSSSPNGANGSGAAADTSGSSSSDKSASDATATAAVPSGTAAS